MNDKNLRIDKEVHELKLGASFEPRSNLAFHSIRYDFKPASVDTASKEALVEIGEKHQVTVNVPHVEGSGTSHTVYKGNKRECPKECVLIIDHATGTFTLERLTNNIQLKKTRMEGASKAAQSGRPLTPVDYNKQKMSPVKPKATPSQISPPSNTESPSITPVHSINSEEPPKDSCPIGEISDSSSSYEDSDSDGDGPDLDKEVPKHVNNPPAPPPPSMPSMPMPSMPMPSMPKLGASFLQNDLQLSDSSSDSD